MEKNNSENAEGILTTVFGPSTWHSMCCIAFNYPYQPSQEDKQCYRLYFESLAFVLPCCICRKHYAENITNGIAKLTDEVFESRETLTKWVYNLHNLVNESLGMNYDISYDDFVRKYNSYIAHCVMTKEQKIIAYKNFYDIEAPIIDYNIAMYFADYANKRGMVNFTDKLQNTNRIVRKSDEWIERNRQCQNIIKNMRLTGVVGFEKDGEFNNLPTIEELQLIQLMSTTLSDKILKHMIKKLGYSIE